MGEKLAEFVKLMEPTAVPSVRPGTLGWWQTGFAYHAVQRQPQRLLVVQGGADGQRHAAQQVAPFGQIGVVEPEQARDAAAPSMFSSSSIFGEPGRVKSSFDLPVVDLPAGRERARVAHRHLGGRGAQHQGLAAADEQANGSVVRRYLRGLHILVDFADDLFALVQQVVGVCPLPVARAICSLIAAICLARLLTVLALFFSSSVTVYWISLMRSAEVRMRDAVSSMRVSTRVRADRSVGQPPRPRTRSSCR